LKTLLTFGNRCHEPQKGTYHRKFHINRTLNSKTRSQVGTSSESGSSSNSSGSSSSSSSSSGSDSSSSDSDASSAPSQRSLRSLKTRGHSTDSDSQPPAKKAATPAAKNANKSVPSKAAAEPDKKGQKNKNSKIAYSSDTDDSVPVKPTTNSSSKQRKVPAKPKATATVTPVVRKPAAPASKTTPKGKSNAQNKAAPKQQPKTKSIFSPEHSSESDGPETPVVKAGTSKAIVQNKNGAIKKLPPPKTAPTASASKSKDPPPRRNTRYSTSTSTGSSNSSGTESILIFGFLETDKNDSGMTSHRFPEAKNIVILF
jgi:histone acetyltransferase MYST2